MEQLVIHINPLLKKSVLFPQTVMTYNRLYHR